MVIIERRETGTIKSQRRLKRDSRESAMMSPGGLSEAKQASWIKVVEGERGDGSWLRERLQNAERVAPKYHCNNRRRSSSFGQN